MIDYLSGHENNAATMFNYVLDNNIPYGISPLTCQETLQGVRTEKDFIKLNDYLTSLRFYELADPKTSYAAAALIYFKCRKKGLTINSSADCLIAQTAIEHNLFLLHNDSDFDKISKVVDLKIFKI